MGGGAYQQMLRELTTTLQLEETPDTKEVGDNMTRVTYEASERDPNLLTIPQAARLLGVCESTVRAHLAKGTLPGLVRVGRRCFVSRVRLQAYLHGHTVPPSAPDDF
jgi:excisionase family DNA binding protein